RSLACRSPEKLWRAGRTSGRRIPSVAQRSSNACRVAGRLYIMNTDHSGASENSARMCSHGSEHTFLRGSIRQLSDESLATRAEELRATQRPHPVDVDDEVEVLSEPL